MRAKISEKQEIARGTLMVTYKVEEAFEFRAGQYFFITLPKLKYLDEKGGRRQFSIVNSLAFNFSLTFPSMVDW